jgi:hypothetical protein
MKQLHGFDDNNPDIPIQSSLFFHANSAWSCLAYCVSQSKYFLAVDWM